jgi:hypothetical protein
MWDITVPGDHAETTILNNLAEDEEIVFGAASRNTCWDCRSALSSDPGLVIGGEEFKGGPNASPYRMTRVGRSRRLSRSCTAAGCPGSVEGLVNLVLARGS